MEFFRDTKIDFMKYRGLWAIASSALVVLAIVTIFFHGKLNIGIDFTGGTQLVLRFQETPRIENLRDHLAAAGFADAQIQSFGAEEAAEVLIRTPLGEDLEGNVQEILEALDGAFNADRAGSFDLNRGGVDALTSHLLAQDPFELARNDQALARTEYEAAAEKVLGVRQEQGILTAWSDLDAAGLEPEIRAELESSAQLGSFALLGEEVVGPAIGAELRRKGLLAVVFSILVMLLYIWMRFELRFGVGAVLAIIHDVLVTLGLYAFLDFEFGLATIAAFLTLVGYSVNDTVVVFDRVRENMHRSRRLAFSDLLNQSINQTLSRTVLTSGTTLLAVGALLFLGGEVLRGFSFVLFIGVIVGTYSSIFVASAFSLLWEELTSSGAKSEPAKKKKSEAKDRPLAEAARRRRGA